MLKTQGGFIDTFLNLEYQGEKKYIKKKKKAYSSAGLPKKKLRVCFPRYLL